MQPAAGYPSGLGGYDVSPSACRVAPVAQLQDQVGRGVQVMDTCPIRLVDDETVLRLVDLETVALPFEVTAGRHLLIADSPGDFAACCGRLMRDPALGR